MPTSESVLYYPSIEFTNEEWLKSALLVWDRVYRIVPAGYEPRDSEDVREVVDCDLVRSVVLEDEDRARAAGDYLRFVDGIGYVPDGLESEYDRLHPDKVGGKLYPLLEELAGGLDQDGWLRVGPAVARGYVFYLSQAIAARRGLVTGTDDYLSWTLNGWFAEAGNISEFVSSPSDGYYSILVVDQLVPDDLWSVPMREIRKFAEQRQSEKAAFRHALGDFKEALQGCESSSHLNDIVSDFSGNLTARQQELRESMGFVDSEQSSSLLGVGLPAALTAFGVFVGTDNPFALEKLFGSFLVGAVAALADYSKSKATRRTSGMDSYLLALESMAPGDSTGFLVNAMHEFIND